MSISREILAIISSIKETANDFTRGAGIQIGVGDETTRTGEVPSGYDTVPPRLMDIDRDATISNIGNGYYESLEEGVAYYATTVGVGRKAEKDRFIQPKGKGNRVYFSKSKAVENWTQYCKKSGFKTFAIVSVKNFGINPDGTFTDRIRVLHVEYVPVS